MIEIYTKSNSNYEANGDMVLEPSVATLNFKENEVFLEHYIDDIGRWTYLEVDNVVAFMKNNKKQFFRIYNVVKSIYKVTAYARPLFYDLSNNIILKSITKSMNGQEALTEVLKGTPYKAHSNITTTSKVDWLNMNIVEALLSDDERSFLSVYGGEFLIDGWDIYINTRVGSETGVSINLGYNLNEIEYSVDTSEVITRIVPISKDNIKLNDTDKPWLDSANLSKYPTPKTRVMTFDDVFVKENADDEEGYKDKAEVRKILEQKCKDLFAEGIDQPLTNFKVDMVNLAQTTAYKDVKPLVTVNGGDTLSVNVPHLGLSNLKTRVIDYEWNILEDNYNSIELGSAIDNYLQNQADIQARVTNITNNSGQVKADVLAGVIDSHKAIFKATKDVAQPQDVLGMIYEDKIEDSPTFGSLIIGSNGMAMADKYVAGTENWDYSTFLTGSGIVADAVTTGTMSANRIRGGQIVSSDGTLSINLEDGAFKFSNANGELIIDNTSKIHKIVKEINTEIKVVNGKQTTTTVAHNLGYRPVYSAFQMGADGTEEYTTIPALSWSQNGATALIRCRVDSKNFMFDFMPSNQYTGRNLTIKIKVFIYKEVAF